MAKYQSTRGSFTSKLAALFYMLVVLVPIANTHSGAQADSKSQCDTVSKYLLAAGTIQNNSDILSFGASLCTNNCVKQAAWFVTGGNDLLAESPLGRTASNSFTSYIQSKCVATSPNTEANGNSSSGAWNPHANCPQVAKLTSFGNLLAHKSCIWNTDYPKSNFAGADMHLSQTKKSDLSKSNFAGADLTFSVFTQVDLSNSNFKEANLTGALFVNCNLEGADFSKAKLQNAKFEGVKLGRANLSKATLSSLTSSEVSGIPKLPTGYSVQQTDQWIAGPALNFGAKSTWPLHALYGADLSDSDLTNFTFANNFKSGNLRGDPILPPGYVLAAGYLIGPGLNLANADLRSGDLSNVKSGGVSGNPRLPSGWALRKGYLLGPTADLSGTDLSGINFQQLDLSSSNLYRVSSGKCSGQPKLPKDFRLASGYIVGPGVKLKNADLSGQNLSNMSIADTALNNVDLRGADLHNTVTGPVLINNYVQTDPKYSLVRLRQSFDAPFYIFGPGVLIQNTFGSEGTSFENISLKGKDLTGIKISAGVTFINAKFSNSNLSRAIFSNVKGRGINFDDSNLTQATFEDVRFADLSMLRVNFEDSRFSGFFDYYDEYFRGVAPEMSYPYQFWKFYSSDSASQHLLGPKVDLSDLDLSNPDRDSVPSGCDLSGANLTGVKVLSWWIEGCKNANVN